MNRTVECKTISDALPVTDKRLYELIPQEIRGQFEERFREVLRWEHPYSFPKWNPDFCESDLDHVIGMLEMVNHIEDEYPGLNVNFSAVRFMIILHDIGEIGVGDSLSVGVNTNSTQFKEQKWQENIFAKQLIHQLPQEFKTSAKHLYQRYLIQDSNDPEALLVKLIDKIQGNEIGCKYIFNAQDREVTDPLKNHVRSSLRKLFEKTQKVIDFADQNSQPLFAKLATNLLAENIRCFFDAGFQTEVNETLRENDVNLIEFCTE